MEYEKGSNYKFLQEKYKEGFIENLKYQYHSHNILPLIQKSFPIEAEINVLEFGPGLGLMTKLLYDIYPNIKFTAIDVDQSILDRISQNHKNASCFKIQDSVNLAEFLDNKKFDIIIALDVWEHLPKKDLEEYTKLSYNSLNEKGIFIAQVPNIGCPFTANTTFAGDLTHITMLNELSSRQLLVNSGIPGEEITILPYKFPPINFLWRIRSFTRSIILMLYKLFLIALGLQKLDICTPNLIMLVEKQIKN